MPNLKTAIRTALGTILAALLILAAYPVGAQRTKKNKDSPPKPDATDKTEEATDATGTEGETSTTGDPSLAVESGRQTALVAVMMLKVINPTEARGKLEQRVAKLGGFPVLITDELLALKVPPEKLSEMLQFASEQGLVLEKTLERHDLTESIAQLEGRLKSKLEILNRLRGFFDDSNVAATLRIEQTMTDLVSEIEEVKGQLRVARERAKFAVIDVAFQFQRRDRIIYVRSPFEWLNSVNLDRFLEDF